MDLKGDRPLNLYAKGHLNVALLRSAGSARSPRTASTDADVTVQGTMAKPVMNGRVVIAHAGFSLIDLPAALGELNGTLVFNQDRLEVEQSGGTGRWRTGELLRLHDLRQHDWLRPERQRY